MPMVDPGSVYRPWHVLFSRALDRFKPHPATDPSEQEREKRASKVVARTIIQRGTMPILLAAVLALSTLHASAFNEFHYDPASCKTDAKGHLYIAVGENVLAVPFLKNGVYGLNSVLPYAKRLAPDPTEPEGCPGNPSQQHSFTFDFGTPLVDPEKGVTLPAHREAPRRLTLYGLDPVSGPTPKADQTKWLGENGGLAELRCSDAAIRETLPNGLTACRTQPTQNTRVEDWAASYIADPSVYTTPLGRPFIVDCGAFLYSTIISHCRVAYVFAPGLAVGYEFQPYLGSTPIPIDHIIEFDRQLRAHIDAALVKDFIWPNQDNGNNGTARGKP